jgi:uncharacterized protein
MLVITPIVAAILAVLFVRLSFAVIRLRRSNKISLGTGGNESLERAIRAQGNFSEYTPFGIILIAILEINGAPWWLVFIPGITLIMSRYFHAQGINTPPPDFKKRILGMQLTFFTYISLVILNLGWMLYRIAFHF